MKTTERTTKLGGVTGKGFMPGKSGNPGGRPKQVFQTVALNKLIQMVRKGKIQETALEHIVSAQIKSAMKGDTKAFTALRDTVDGRPMQVVEVGGTITYELTERERREARESLRFIQEFGQLPEAINVEAKSEETNAGD